MSALPLRPFLLADTPRLQDLYAQAIEELTQDEYDDEQRLAWITRAADAQEFANRLGKNVTILVEQGGEILGFASLAGNSEIDMLYVHPYATGQGVGSALVDALERLAKARGAETLMVEASDTAHEFFSRRGYADVRRNTVPMGEVWLSNTTMMKPLAKSATASSRSH
ncbi:MAG TPA: GNAT family N-acetyltransferase [Hyphomicrobiaceae bacterium]|nr:GNAT family N-acetyltransferase [Hyphomicrobiaceae bacterium]